MIKRISDILAGIPPTIASGIFLLIDLIPHLTEEFTGAAVTLVSLPFDPACVTVIISGIPLVYLAVWRLIHNKGIAKISSALLIVIAMFAAIGIGDLFAAGEVAWIMAVGAILEDKTTERARKGLKQLIELVPAQGRRIVNGREELVPADQIRQGDVLRILPGETVPVDGTIMTGETSIDQSVMTGESLPVDKTVGDDVFCGTLNRFGSIDIRATNVGENSSLAQLIRLVREAEDKQAPMQRIADRAASWLVPVALGIAVTAHLITGNIVTAVTVLVVFCPCALVLATPTAIMAAIGQATKHGVIIKSGEALETMGKVDVVAFDKTGTITRGTLAVSDVLPLTTSEQDGEANGATDGTLADILAASLSASKLLALAASAESRSEHPLGRAIVEAAREQALPLTEPDTFSMTAGRGIRAEIAGQQILCGSEAFLAEHGITLCPGVQTALARLRDEGKASVLVARAAQRPEDAGRCLGVIALSDTIRPGAQDMICQLKAIGVRTVLLTGDNERTAHYVAERVGVDEVRAQLLPQEKVRAVEELRAQGRTVCMIGDGVNDAPALKGANVGAAMGGMGSNIAIDAADIALMSDNIAKIPYLKRLSNGCVRTIKTSITLSMTINFMAIGLSLAGLLNPTTGALVHNAGSCAVVLFAALLYDRSFD